MERVETLFDRAEDLRQSGRADLAQPLYRQILAQPADEPPSVVCYARRAKALERLGDTDAAMQAYVIATLLQCLTITPTDAASWVQLGLALHQAGRADHANSAFRAALVCHPSLPEACNNAAMLQAGVAAVAWQGRAVGLAPERADFRTNLAHALLACGRFAEGFRAWDWRTLSPPRVFAQPRWEGQPFAGQTLLVHADQGYGDALQFCRYLPWVVALGGRVIVETRAPLAGLLGRIPGLAGLTLWGDPLPACDLQIALPSLAARFLEIPLATPYLTALPAKMDVWRQRLAAAGGQDRRLKVGLIWAGNPRGLDSRRALPLALLGDWMAGLPDIQFFSLQRDAPQVLPEPLTPLGDQIDDFDDLAGALAGIDLLISVDTAAAHLAGALARPVWVMLHAAADWRWWGPTSETSLWYPSARLYRQTWPGDWSTPLQRMAEDLRGLT